MSEQLPPQPDVNAIEQEVLAFWREQSIYQQSEQQRAGQTPFVIYDGPPTANAKPALHHMIPASFKDLVGRYQTMRGHYVRRQAGWDTHGLPVEVQVERALGLSGKKDVLNLVPGDERASIAKFNEICRTSVWEYKQDWERFVERQGYWTNTETPYITYDPTYVEAVWGVLKKVWDQELVYKGYKVVPYCPRCGTALSSIEVADGYQDVRDVSVFVTFPLIGQPTRGFLAWTTTPWTLPGNTALAVNPKLTYVVVQQEGQEYILAKSRLEVLKGEYTLLEEVSGQSLVGQRYQPPFADAITAEGEKFIVIAADFVTDSDGSGIVHVAPMYGEDDFAAGRANGLAMQHTVGLDGNFLLEVPVVGGLYAREALGTILTHLTEQNALYVKQGFTHSYPHCWRCKTPLLYYAKDSWFVAMSGLRQQLVASNARVTWIPEHIKDGRFGGFISEARDWAISRERFWGTPLPIWKSEEGEQYLCIGSLEELRALAENPSEIGSEFDPHRPQVDDVVLVKDGVRYRREPLVLDVWFDSGSMPYASGRLAAGEFPADYIAEAVDQTRGWFYTLLALGTILEAKSAYKAVVCMGHLVDEQGKKMSKSVGNVFNPFEMMEQVGADSLRWFFYTVNSPGETKAFSIKDVQVGFRKTLLLTYNMVQYWLTYAPGAHVTTNELSTLDHWAAAREAETVAEVTANLEQYDFMRAGRALEAYINDLSTWYLRRSRKRTDSVFFDAFAVRLRTLLTLLAPFTPFMTEYLYRHLSTDNTSIHLENWPTAEPAEQDVLLAMRQLRELVEAGQALRAESKIKVRQPLAALFVQTKLELTPELQSILMDELNVQAVEVVASLPTELPARQDANWGVALDTTMTDALVQAGLARDLQRQLQNVRKIAGLQPGESAELLAGPYAQALLEPLLENFPEILSESSLVIGTDSWQIAGSESIQIGNEVVYVTVRPEHVESV